MKYNFIVKEIEKELALEMVQKYHYSNTLPRLNKHFIGFYLEEELVGVVTLGYGTRPMHTIKKLFPSLDTKDYYEIGRMCMTEEMPKNSESQMISHLIKWMKQNTKDIKVLFTWADGMRGKPGYVYQACSFLYAGYCETDTYMKNGVQLHPRQTAKIFKKDKNDKRKTIRPTMEQMTEYGISHVRGYQFKYLTFLCSKGEKKRLTKECTVELNTSYPKHEDMRWRTKVAKGKYEESPKPEYKTDVIVDDVIKEMFTQKKVNNIKED